MHDIIPLVLILRTSIRKTVLFCYKKENKNFFVLHYQIDYQVKYSRRHNSQVSNVTSNTKI